MANVKDKGAHSPPVISIERLKQVMSALRDPDSGCPWDLEQNFKSIAPYTLEEAYEVVDAIDRGDMINLREELGDLLFQSVYHAQMASEQGAFTLDDVINDVTEKMIYRHPHVFGEKTAKSAEDVNAIWDERKSQEKSSVSEASTSALDDVPLALPALLRAQKLQKRAAKTGFVWREASQILDKLEEEIAEIREAIASGKDESIKDEMGDLLFVMANLARHYGINAEEALRCGNAKFEKRFKGMEDDLKNDGKVMQNLTLDQMLELWVKQKQVESL